MIDESSCGLGMHVWKDHPTCWECTVCHLIEMKGIHDGH